MGTPTGLPKDFNFFKDLPTDLLAHIGVQSGQGVKFRSVSKATEEAVQDAAASCLTILREHLKEEPKNPIYKALETTSAEKNSIARIGKVYEELKGHGYDLKEGFKALNPDAILTNFQEVQHDRALVALRPMLEVNLRLSKGTMGSSGEEIRNWLNNNQGHISTLKQLNLSALELDILPPEIGLFVGLEFLSLDTNNLMDLPVEMKKLKHLKDLFISSNEFKVFPSVLAELPKLERLDLNHIPELSLTNISKCKCLKMLFLRINEYKAIPTEIFELKNLEFLDLSSNNLTSIPSDILKLERLKKLIIYCDSLEMSSKDLELVAILKERGCEVDYDVSRDD